MFIVFLIIIYYVLSLVFFKGKDKENIIFIGKNLRYRGYRVVWLVFIRGKRRVFSGFGSSLRLVFYVGFSIVFFLKFLLFGGGIFTFVLIFGVFLGLG